MTFEGRLLTHVRELSAPVDVPELRDASAVYAEGVLAGLSLAIAALQRRERLIDYLQRWENALRQRREREGHHEG